FTVIATTPSVGSSEHAGICAFANAIPNDSSIPITSPVDRISGPTITSTSNLLNGNTASFTATPGTAGSSGTESSSSRFPAITRAASRANGTPVAFETNGTVRDARGFTSSTYTTPSLIAYCTLISPT